MMKRIRVKSWEINILDKKLRVSPEIVQNLQEKIIHYPELFKGEKGTWIYEKFRVPSLIIRVDCCLQEEKVFIYEIEERPAGIGLTKLINSQFDEYLWFVRKNWPEVKVVISPMRNGWDDDLWLPKEQVKVFDGRFPKDLSGHWLIRAEPEEEWVKDFVSYSISTALEKGNKEYLLKMKLAYPVGDIEKLPWEEGFVVKPRRGSKCRGILIWDPYRRPGSSTRSKIIQALAQKEQREKYLWQPLRISSASFLGEGWFYILRLYWGWNPVRRTYLPLGGAWNARRNMRVHGASDALFGPALL